MQATLAVRDVTINASAANEKTLPAGRRAAAVRPPAVDRRSAAQAYISNHERAQA